MLERCVIMCEDVGENTLHLWHFYVWTLHVRMRCDVTGPALIVITIDWRRRNYKEMERKRLCTFRGGC